MKIKHVSVLCVAGAMFSAMAADTAGVRKALKPYVDRQEIPGYVSVLIDGDREEWVADGWSDIAKRTPLKKDSLFRICSQTKGIVGAAAANRFLRWRFSASACLLTALAQPVALVLAVVAGGFKGTAIVECVRLFPAFAVLAGACLVFIAFAAALATRFASAHVTAAISFAVVVSFLAAHISGVCPPAGWAIRAVLPVLSDFWMSERLAGGGAIPVAETLRLLSAAALLVVLWLGVGSALLSRRELS